MTPEDLRRQLYGELDWLVIFERPTLELRHGFPPLP